MKQIHKSLILDIPVFLPMALKKKGFIVRGGAACACVKS